MTKTELERAIERNVVYNRACRQLDRFIDVKDLTAEDLIHMHHDQLNLFAYNKRHCADYERVKSGLVLVQKTYGRRTVVDEVDYIIDQTALTRWQKIKLKFMYRYL